MKPPSIVLPLALVAGAAGYGIYDHFTAEPPRPAPPPVVADGSPVVAGEGPILSQMELDGLPIFPGIPTVDPRPICDAADNPLTLKIVLIWSDGHWVSCSVTQPLFRRISLELAQFGDPFTLEFDPPEVWGDVTGNAEVTTLDLAKVQAKFGPIAADASRVICDLDRSGVVDSIDADLVRQVLGIGQ